ncbi:G-type lectin S-receptor-like serine/threonine-protein kinase RKS1 [Morus notabilis]|uniref:Receptor-like serine/threonine-protein kinase n=1 Tax=Morus notabilis TaxID=981085 RepID=W9SEU6_9ROSA|nr:G-type lectin S-receptor-like serine/threonine-protein kinase RKS1 [Morus notabilis]EXC29551.1 G-type lectin S-receptor-like serine/threonine-protein kinase RKS1 [Morus notabilis]
MKSCEALLNTIQILLIFLAPPLCMSLVFDTITPNHPIKDGDVLLSGQKTFALGFFSPGKPLNRYVGVWYNKISEKTVVWVANRDNPINDTSGVLAINSKGRLSIYAKYQNSPIWSANLSVFTAKTSSTFIAKLLDVGNLVLMKKDDSFGQSSVIWQSFDYPTNTYLPFLKLGLNRKTGLDRFITSWKSADDPGTGNCTYRMNLTGYPQMILYKGQVPFWRAGCWTGRRWTGVPTMIGMINGFIFNVSYTNNKDETSIMYGINNDTNSVFSRLVIDESGTARRSTWQDQRKEWVEFSYVPAERCDNYGICGRNGKCNQSDASQLECVCLPGFEPHSRDSWDLRDRSGGCMRKGGARTCGDGEGFAKVTRVKLPDTFNARGEMGLNLRECEEKCLKDCNCTAYTSLDETRDGAGCLSWHGDLVDIRTFTNAGQDLYVRVDAVTLAQYAKKSNGSISKTGKLAILLCSVVIFFLLVFIAYWLANRKRISGKERRNTKRSNFSEEGELDDGKTDSDVPLFDLHTIAIATANFSAENKLGQGGFGSVYKGMLSNGKEIAVKRLSRCSRQGSTEFRNEVQLVAKLQHKNLVRILGCCFHEEERMLVYEYLPNKSLDSFIFDEEKRKSLDWRRRFDIICGIARGILYLHQDSILRIIHRDLKASNVLLDAALNPKISDFGLARIFGEDQSEACTNRVVGTYGYMAPEYAMEGLFSTKSDVYSFGVLLLEIITGRKNIDYYEEKSESNLLGHVWDLWKEGRASEIVDPFLDESFVDEALRCIQIGLLSVQEHANDRPTMSAIVLMLGNDSALPSPKQPAFILNRCWAGTGDRASSEGVYNSINIVSCTMVEAR